MIPDQIFITTWADWARLLNLALALGCFIGMAVAWRDYKRDDRSGQMLRAAIACLVIGITVGTVETLTYEAPAPGIRSYAFTIGLAWLLVSIAWGLRDRRR